MLPLWQLIKLHRQRITATTFLLLAVFLLFIVRADSPAMHALKGGVVHVMGGIQQILLSPVEAFRAASVRLAELQRLDDDNQKLRRQVETLLPAQVALQEALKENHRLRQLLSMPVDPRYSYLAARVVGDSSSAFSRALLVNAGKQEKVMIDTPAVSPRGLVGRVVTVGKKRATVLTLQDINSHIPVMVQRSRMRAVAAGRNSALLKLLYVPKEGDIQVGDLLITSGTGGIFPKGITVGRVSALAIRGSGLFREAFVRPQVQMDLLEEVRLMLPVAGAHQAQGAVSSSAELNSAGQRVQAAGEPTP
uniref:Cell shape-determining protein MreC n=1 Tax=Magnetococcus massalia (strain MO-1) TaxID=451514 RepID=A0A1S7LD51_MAGMO|nr:putative Rod shape-determining protein MreC [Candidatus Magnetococcus massalia]